MTTTTTTPTTVITKKNKADYYQEFELPSRTLQPHTTILYFTKKHCVSIRAAQISGNTTRNQVPANVENVILLPWSKFIEWQLQDFGCDWASSHTGYLNFYDGWFIVHFAWNPFICVASRSRNNTNICSGVRLYYVHSILATHLFASAMIYWFSWISVPFKIGWYRTLLHPMLDSSFNSN